MKIIEDIQSFQRLQQRCVATIGKFDGVHRGHQLILEQLRTQAQALQLPSVVIVIEPHPEEFFAVSPQDCPARLSEPEEKLQLIAAQGIDYAFKLRFDEQLCKLSAEDYIESILVEGLGIAGLIIGSDFRFGNQRKGDFSLLQDYGNRYDFQVLESASCEVDGLRVSSTLVRQKLAEADFESVAALLGRQYAISGTVVKGQQLGRDLGFPTCNVRLNRRNIPLHGVYACDVIVQDGQLQTMTLHGAANIGYRPTVSDDNKAILEVHLLDFSGDLYDTRISVLFRHRIRAEVKFDSLQALLEQIAIDVNDTREFFAVAGR